MNMGMENNELIVFICLYDIFAINLGPEHRLYHRVFIKPGLSIENISIA